MPRFCHVPESRKMPYNDIDSGEERGGVHLASLTRALFTPLPGPPNGGPFGFAACLATGAVLFVVLGLEVAYGLLIPAILRDPTLGASLSALSASAGMMAFVELALGVAVSRLVEARGPRFTCAPAATLSLIHI